MKEEKFFSFPSQTKNKNSKLKAGAELFRHFFFLHFFDSRNLSVRLLLYSPHFKKNYHSFLKKAELIQEEEKEDTIK